MGTTQDAGSKAEDEAQRYLIENGLVARQRNYRCRGGEIDLVMRDGDCLVFIEVRYRRRSGFGGALASIDARKQRRVIHAAQHYLARHNWQGPCRFDVIAFDGDAPQQWIRDAFGT
ncbi:MAG: YraN family protein [Gammaproteobacteria bacterium]|nr:YraN family protein [Gammaproteobacteria bacterium]